MDINDFIRNIETHSPKKDGYAYNIVTGMYGRYMLTFYVNPQNPDEWGTEIYAGENYVVGSKDRSWSRNYKRWRKLPEKWMPVAMALKNLHRKRFRR